MYKFLSVKKIVFFYLITLLLVSCGPQRPSHVLEPDKMEAFLYDFHIAKSIGDDEDYSDRYKRSIYVDYVYEKHHITKEQFDESMIWYTRNLPELVKIYEKVSERIGDDKEEIDQLVAWQYDVPMVSISGDSVDVWAWHQIYRLTGTPLNNKMTFTLPADSNFVEGDQLEWNVHLQYEKGQLDSLSLAVMQMAMYFENDSSLVKTLPIYESGMCQLSLQSDSLGKIKNVKGFIYYPPQAESNRLLIDSISLYRYHKIKNDSILNSATDSLSLGQEMPLDSLRKE